MLPQYIAYSFCAELGGNSQKLEKILIPHVVFFVERCYHHDMSTKLPNPKREPVNVVAIIPARAGKQSIPWKNLQKLGGKTLLAWAVEVAFAADKVDAVI